MKENLGDKLTIHTAFSRQTSEKIYVQQRLKEQAEIVNDLLQNGKANVYVCGDAANMAREVNIILGQIIAEKRGLTPEKGEDVIKSMRAQGSYQEDVWS